VHVLAAQGVIQGEGVEDVVPAAGHPVALPSAGGNAWVDREDAMPAALQPLDEQPLGALHADRQADTELSMFDVEPFESGDVMA
jgi:hypothetical protein